ncbi:aminoglycoside adenylyltransferase domain-containing protein [Enterocloster asparagiformis]|uniref:aminoglycoside adenylyltransferase domain-containing protein n=1 Tax=Enterocloster asparagiformis TaxID=333367 RepID=UPI002A83FEF5|nr:aminoglycoside adenylyltransferase domain-containing protein [Enterocloster asparagiformis]
MELQIQKVLEQIKATCMDIFSTNLVGIYIHGSLAFGCFNWDKSDIDFIIVTRLSPTLQEKEKLVEDLLKIDKMCPRKGLEMSLVLEEYCHDFLYPTPFELHFSNAHKQKFFENLSEYCAHMNGTDKDLAAHFTIIKQSGITLYGEKADGVFGDVPKANYLDSIKHDIENAVVEIVENPIYIILNLCRVLAYIKDDVVLSKQQGAYWGLENIPVKYARLIDKAEESYRSAEPFSMDIGDALLTDFSGYMLKQIFER